MPYHWNADLYQRKHAFVYQYGADLVEWLNPQPGEDILDLGCGTGQLTNEISQNGANVVGIDQSEEMIQQAHLQYPTISFQVQNATQLKNLPQFDAVFSNATLHWVRDARTALKQVYQHLKTDGRQSGGRQSGGRQSGGRQSGGRFIAELGGKNNIAQIIDALNQQRGQLGFPTIDASEQWFFPSVGEYSSLLESEGFEVLQTSYFHRDTVLAEDGIKNWIIMFAGRWLADLNGEQQEILLKAVQESLRPSLWRDGNWYADYRRLRILAVKV